MLPERSWWNPGIPAGLRTYVLRHEQINFALTEIAARRLTQESREWDFITHVASSGGIGPLRMSSKRQARPSRDSPNLKTLNSFDLVAESL